MKFLVVLCLFLVQLAHAKAEIKVLMVLNEGFQPDEYFVPRQVFEKEGYHIKVATRTGAPVQAGKKYPDTPAVSADLAFTGIMVSDYDIITFTGGGGAWSDYFPDQTLHKVLITAMADKKIITGLICAATGLLALASNLDGESPQFAGRKVTGYGDVKGLLKVMGKLEYSEGDFAQAHVVVDRKLVTGRDPKSATLFAETIVRMMK